MFVSKIICLIYYYY